MAALNIVVLLCIFANFVLCEEDEKKPQALPQTGLENIYTNIYGAQLNLNNDQANLNQAGLNLNQGGYLLNQQPQYSGANAGYLNFNQEPQLSGLNLNNGGYSTLNLQPSINGASYGGAYGNAYSGLTGTDLSSFLGTAVKNYNQQQPGAGLVSSVTSQNNELGIQNLKIQNSNIGLVTPGSNLVQPQTFGTVNPHSNLFQMPNFQINGANFATQDVSQGINLYSPQSISHQGHQPQNAHLGSQSEFQPIQIGGIHSVTNFGGNTNLKSLFETGLNQYGSNQYGYGIQPVQSGYNAQFGSPSGFKPIEATNSATSVDGNTDLKSLFNQHGSNMYGYGSGAFKDEAISYPFYNLHTASHGSYGQESVQNALKFSQNGPQMFQSDNLDTNGFGGNNNIVNGEGHSFKSGNFEIDALESHQEAFKTEDPKSTSYKSKPSGLNAYKTNNYKNKLPNRSLLNKYNVVEPHTLKDTNDFESSEFKSYENEEFNNRYTLNKVRQHQQTKDFESFEYGNLQFNSDQFSNDQHSNKEFHGNTQNSYKGYPNKKHNIYSDSERYGQNAYKVNENTNQNTHERPVGKNNGEHNMNKKEPGMIVHISVKNGDHGYTQSLKYP